MSYDDWKLQTPESSIEDDDLYVKCDLCFEPTSVDEVVTSTYIGNILHRCPECDHNIKQL